MKTLTTTEPWQSWWGWKERVPLRRVRSLLVVNFSQATQRNRGSPLKNTKPSLTQGKIVPWIRKQLHWTGLLLIWIKFPSFSISSVESPRTPSIRSEGSRGNWGWCSNRSEDAIHYSRPINGFRRGYARASRWGNYRRWGNRYAIAEAKCWWNRCCRYFIR